ncbi:MAG TPA: hypothetical protein VFY84_11095 [Jiangellales bacterium]|nr:hypothetical protein [Jiangellales bacterium]
MADQLCTPEDLATLLGQPADARMTLLVEIGTAVVQAETGQRLVEVVDDPVTLLGTTDAWLDLPQRPVTAVTSVSVDGQAISEGTTTGTYRRFGARLWRDCGWATCWTEPSTVEVVNTHGYAPTAQELQLARGAVLSIIRSWWDNTAGVRSERVDDYAVTYEQIAAQLEASPSLRAALRRQYGRRAGLVRVG